MKADLPEIRRRSGGLQLQTYMCSDAKQPGKVKVMHQPATEAILAFSYLHLFCLPLQQKRCGSTYRGLECPGLGPCSLHNEVTVVDELGKLSDIGVGSYQPSNIF